MNPFEQFLQTANIDVLEHFNKQQALDAGIPPNKVREWQLAHEVYYGAATSAAKQRQALDKARRSGLSLDQLCMIERELRRIKSLRTRNKLRLVLLGLRGHYKAVMALVKQRIPKLEKPRQDGVRFSKSKDRKRTMTLTHDEELIADVEHALTHDLDLEKPAMGQMLERLLAILRGKSSGVSRAVRRPIVLIPVDEHLKLLKGDADETTFGLTDGTTITGAELLKQGYGEVLEVATFHPQEGPVNLYRTKRYANTKQRDLARMANPVCTVPDCRHVSDNCQLHHITAWSRGGETNMDNLAVLCRYHNQVNDDDPSQLIRGRTESINGRTCWVSPSGVPVENRHHPYSAMSLLFGSSNMSRR